MGRVDECLHESAHSVVRQLLIGNLGEMGFKKRAAYSYPVERKPFDEMSKSKLEKIGITSVSWTGSIYATATPFIVASS